jgi:FAD dependent oxidoreductase TIGR03364
MRPNYDLVVVGAGVLGSFHAYFAARKGWRVLLIERGDLPGEASVRNFGTLVPGAMPPGDWHRRARESVEVYRDLAGPVGFLFQPCGTLYPATTSAELAVLEEFARIGPAQGYRCELLDTARAAALIRVLNSDQVRAGLLFPDDARVEPRGLFRKLIPWLVNELKVTYLPRTVAVQVSEEGGGAAVSTSDGKVFRASYAVVCGGADLRTLFPEQLAAAGLIVCKLLMLRTGAQPAARLPLTLASGLTLRRYAAFRICSTWSRLEAERVDPELVRRGIHILMVQDADGSIVVGDSHEYSAGDLDDLLDAATEELILREARRLARLPHWEIAQRWYGVYPLLKDAELFRARIGSTIHLVTGIGGKGMTTGPAVARETVEALAAGG